MPKVLLIEDSSTVRTLLKHMFSRFLECEVLEASDGLAGLEAVMAHRPDLVVVDVHLPYLTGPEVLHAIRADAEVAETLCVAITAENDRDVIKQLLAEGVVDIILKPVDLERDAARLRKIIARLPKARTEAPHGAATNDTVLIVDSDDDFRDFAAQALAGRFSVQVAKTGLEGVTALRAAPPAFVLVGERLRHLPERLFVKAARGDGSTAPATRFLLAADSAASAKTASAMGYEGAVLKSKDASMFLMDFKGLVGDAAQAVA
jgi:CheY-like chemotaxis protein